MGNEQNLKNNMTHPMTSEEVLLSSIYGLKESALLEVT